MRRRSSCIVICGHTTLETLKMAIMVEVTKARTRTKGILCASFLALDMEADISPLMRLQSSRSTTSLGKHRQVERRGERGGSWFLNRDKGWNGTVGWCSWLSRQSHTLKVPSSSLGSITRHPLDISGAQVFFLRSYSAVPAGGRPPCSHAGCALQATFFLFFFSFPFTLVI